MNNNQATIQKLEQMKFYGMARAFTSTMETGVKNQFTAWMILALNLLMRRVVSLYWKSLRIDTDENHRSLYLNCL